MITVRLKKGTRCDIKKDNVEPNEPYNGNQSRYSFNFPNGLSCDKLIIEIPGSNKELSLAEVQVFGMPMGDNSTNNTNCSKSQDQSDYRGNISVTSAGLKCQRWDQQSPHSHTRKPINYPNSGLVENYCRNPDGGPRAWCYTTDASCCSAAMILPKKGS